MYIVPVGADVQPFDLAPQMVEERWKRDYLRLLDVCFEKINAVEIG